MSKNIICRKTELRLVINYCFNVVLKKKVDVETIMPRVTSLLKVTLAMISRIKCYGRIRKIPVGIDYLHLYTLFFDN